MLQSCYDIFFNSIDKQNESTINVSYNLLRDVGILLGQAFLAIRYLKEAEEFINKTLLLCLEDISHDPLVEEIGLKINLLRFQFLLS